VNTVALLLVALEYATITLRRGPVVSTVDTATYSRWADLLVAAHFDYFTWSRSIDFVVPPLAYSGWVTVVALNKLAFGAAWADGILALNLAAAIVSVGIVLRLVAGVTASRLAVGAAAASFFVAFELFLWIPYALADVTFMFLTVAVFSLLVSNALSGGHHGLARRALPFALGLLALAYRPAALPLVVVMIVAGVAGGRLRAADAAARVTAARRIGVGIGFVIAAAILVDALLMSDPSRWPFPFLSSWIRELGQEFQAGYVIYGRPETYHPAPGGFLDYVWLDVDRLRSFFVFTAAGFSREHVLVNVAFFVPAYVGWAIAAVSLLRGKSGSTWPEWWATVLGTLFVLSFCLFHSLQQIDFDWRYRLPCLPVLAMLAAIGWHRLLRRFGTSREPARNPD
jgi:hypothetical protein